MVLIFGRFVGILKRVSDYSHHSSVKHLERVQITTPKIQDIFEERGVEPISHTAVLRLDSTFYANFNFALMLIVGQVSCLERIFPCVLRL